MKNRLKEKRLDHIVVCFFTENVIGDKI